jgi:hypothetical protein
MGLRLGDLLVQRGQLTRQQCDEIFERQRGTHTPFGVLAEELFGVDPGAVEDAWAVQFAGIAPRVDPSKVDVAPDMLDKIERRQAWQFGLIPLGVDEHGLVFVTSTECLARAMRFAGWRVMSPFSFVICEHNALRIGLETHYPMPGMNKDPLDAAMSRPSAA